MGNTKIDWATKVWNPVTGCTHAGSPGCDNCYAKRMSKRLRGRFGYPADNPFRVTLHPERLVDPLSWKKPQRVFVCSMGDLFHENMQGNWPFLSDIWDIIFKCPQHIFIVLTKRPEFMKRFIIARKEWWDGRHCSVKGHPSDKFMHGGFLHNLWIGVSVENQEQADKRIPILLQIPATVRFVSIEPMLGPIDLMSIIDYKADSACIDSLSKKVYEIGCHSGTIPNGLDWVICGGESGHKARPMHPDWARAVRDQCVAAAVPFFFKQFGEWKLDEIIRTWTPESDPRRELDGTIWSQFPEVKS